MDGIEKSHTNITVTTLNVQKNDILKSIGHRTQRVNPCMVEATKLYYYPYYLFESQLITKKCFGTNFSKLIFYAMDAICGYFMLTRGVVELSVIKCEHGSFLPPQISPDEAVDKGVELYKTRCSLLLKSMFWQLLKEEIQVDNWQLVYKPFWLVKVNVEKGVRLQVIDATTGEIGGVQGYRFLQGLSLNYNNHHLAI